MPYWQNFSEKYITCDLLGFKNAQPAQPTKWRYTEISWNINIKKINQTTFFGKCFIIICTNWCAWISHLVSVPCLKCFCDEDTSDVTKLLMIWRWMDGCVLLDIYGTSTFWQEGKVLIYLLRTKKRQLLWSNSIRNKQGRVFRNRSRRTSTGSEWTHNNIFLWANLISQAFPITGILGRHLSVSRRWQKWKQHFNLCSLWNFKGPCMLSQLYSCYGVSFMVSPGV